MDFWSPIKYKSAYVYSYIENQLLPLKARFNSFSRC